MEKKRGGAREGAGRKPKATEQELLDKLTPYDDIALESLKKGVQAGDFNFTKLFMEYRFGKPKQDIGLTADVELATKVIFK